MKGLFVIVNEATGDHVNSEIFDDLDKKAIKTICEDDHEEHMVNYENGNIDYTVYKLTEVGQVSSKVSVTLSVTFGNR